MFGDIALNLISELIGILVTVFFVDKLLEKRERVRWMPIKNFVLSKIYGDAETFLSNSGIAVLANDRKPPIKLLWGNVAFTSFKNYDSINYQKLMELMESENQCHLLYEYIKSNDSENLTNSFYSLLDLCGPFLEPVMFEYSMKIDEQIKICRRLDLSEIDLIRISISTIFAMILQFMVVIKKSADKRVKLDHKSTLSPNCLLTEL